MSNPDGEKSREETGRSVSAASAAIVILNVVPRGIGRTRGGRGTHLEPWSLLSLCDEDTVVGRTREWEVVRSLSRGGPIGTIARVCRSDRDHALFRKKCALRSTLIFTVENISRKSARNGGWLTVPSSSSSDARTTTRTRFGARAAFAAFARLMRGARRVLEERKTEVAQRADMRVPGDGGNEIKQAAPTR